MVSEKGQAIENCKEIYLDCGEVWPLQFSRTLILHQNIVYWLNIGNASVGGEKVNLSAPLNSSSEQFGLSIPVLNVSLNKKTPRPELALQLSAPLTIQITNDDIEATAKKVFCKSQTNSARASRH